MQLTLQMCKMCLVNSADGIGEKKSLILWGFFNMVLVRSHCFFMVVLASHLLNAVCLYGFLHAQKKCKQVI